MYVSLYVCIYIYMYVCVCMCTSPVASYWRHSSKQTKSSMLFWAHFFNDLGIHLITLSSNQPFTPYKSILARVLGRPIDSSSDCFPPHSLIESSPDCCWYYIALGLQELS